MTNRAWALPALFFSAAFAAASCGDDVGQEVGFAGECPTPGVGHVRFFRNIRFTEPVAMKQLPGESSHFYVAEHRGVIKRVPNDPNAQSAEIFADLSQRVHYDWEAGLNGIAFHPKFSENGEVYVTYTGFPEGDQNKFVWILSRFVSPDGGRTLDVNSEQIVLRITKDNDGGNRDHNAGDLAFGPHDGMLYVSVGDGGTQHDPELDALRLSSLSGKVLRIDINKRRPSENIHYGIPEDNPFVNVPGARGEVWAYGFRNPWRMTFDRVPNASGVHALWVGESGQNAMEEIELVDKGSYHGWPLREGIICHDQGPGCSGANIAAVSARIGQGNITLGKDPAWAFWHKPNEANATVPPYLISAIGGYVYRGSEIQGLQGVYLFANFEPGDVYGLYNVDGNNVPLKVDRLPRVSSFAEDNRGELYVLDYSQGQIYKLVGGPCATKPETPENSYVWLSQDGLGSEADAFAYYDSIGAPRDLSLAKWIEQSFGTLPVIRAVYKNDADLGFWREMNCTETIGPGKGGCWVRNWDNPDNPTSGEADKRKDLGTVTMNISEQGFTRFYIFGPPSDERIAAGATNSDRVLSPLAVLDSEGPKFLPQLCTPCHGGKFNGLADVGGIWREFEPNAFQPRPGVTPAEANQEWFRLNQAVRSANDALASEAEGSVQGVDQAKANMIAYIDAIYDTSVNPPAPVNIDDPRHIPADWAKPVGNPVYEQAKADLWTKFVNRYCETCHRANNTFDFAKFETFQNLAAESNGRPAIYGFIEEDPDDPQRALLPFMPQAEFLKNILADDAEAFAAVDNWLTQEQNPSVAQCTVRFVVNGADVTQVGQDVVILGSIAELGEWRPESGGLRMTTSAGLWPTWIAQTTLPQGAIVEYKHTVYKGDAHNFWEAGNNHVFQVPATGVGCQIEVVNFWQKF